MRIIAIGNQKGGVGKTTTALNLGHALAELERRVVLIDLDPQASLTVAAGAGDRAGCSMAEVLLGGLSLSDVLLPMEGRLNLAPGDIQLSEVELILVGKMGRESVLKKALAPMARSYDYCLLDLPPSLGLLTVNGLAAAESVLIPAIPQYLDQRALRIFFRTIDKVREELNTSLVVLGVLPTFYDARLKLHGETLEAWLLAGLPVLPMRVRRSVRVAESPIGGQPVAAYSPEHAEPYRQLAAEMEENA